jgi:hypothetical protein
VLFSQKSKFSTCVQNLTLARTLFFFFFLVFKEKLFRGLGGPEFIGLSGGMGGSFPDTWVTPFRTMGDSFPDFVSDVG